MPTMPITTNHAVDVRWAAGCCVNVPDPRRSQPSAADYPVPVLEGPGLIGPTNQLCAVQWDPTQVNKVVRIVLVENQIKPVT